MCLSIMCRLKNNFVESILFYRDVGSRLVFRSLGLESKSLYSTEPSQQLSTGFSISVLENIILFLCAGYLVCSQLLGFSILKTIFMENAL